MSIKVYLFYVFNTLTLSLASKAVCKMSKEGKPKDCPKKEGNSLKHELY